jgi:hypothetical protein
VTYFRGYMSIYLFICLFRKVIIIIILFLAAVCEYELFIYNLKKPRVSPDKKYNLTDWLLVVSS